MPNKTKKPSSAAGRRSTGDKRRIPLRITDTTLRDAHQSLWATRLRTEDIREIIDVVDQAGYYSLEVWGGATFDVCLRFLRENPWERLRIIKAGAKKTPLQMLLRGQNILGYRNYADDILERFIALAVLNGIDIFRVFDALNDSRNLEHAIKVIKQHGAHAQGTLCYTISPVHTVETFVQSAREQVALGIDSLCIKDMAGILSPISAERLITALIKEIDVPIQVHSHMTSGMAVASYVEAVRAGAGAIDCAISSMSGTSSQPPVETMLAIFDETAYKASLDVDALRRICKYFTGLGRKRAAAYAPPQNPIDPGILLHHIPGGMISNLRSQLQQQDALDRIDQVFEELPKVRKDLGYPPLVTPTSQIIGIQSVMNVLSGERYAMVPQEVKDYVMGLYGRSPAPIDPAIRSKILGKQKPIDCRPADLLSPMLPTATRDIDPKLIRNEEDILSYCLFPEPATEYFKWRDLAPNERPPIPADMEEAQHRKASEIAPAPEPQPLLSAADYEALQNLLDRVHKLNFNEFSIRRNDLSVQLRGDASDIQLRQTDSEDRPLETSSSTPPAGKPDPEGSKAAASVDRPANAISEAATITQEPPPDANAATITAPLNGTFFLSSNPGQPPFVKEGDTVKTGAVVCIVEAMKLFNQIKAPSDSRIVSILAKHGDPVKKGQSLIVYEELP